MKEQMFLCCDFGYDVTSPIPSAEPGHKNFHSVVPAVVGTTVKLFPNERLEVAEFVSDITNENGQTVGLKYRIKIDPVIARHFDIQDEPGWEIDLMRDKPVYVDDNAYENGKSTHTYRRLLLTEKGENDGSWA